MKKPVLSVKPVDLVRAAIEPFVSSGGEHLDELTPVDVERLLVADKLLATPVDLDTLAEISYVADALSSWDMNAIDELSQLLGRKIDPIEFINPLSAYPESTIARHRAAAKAIAEALGFVCDIENRPEK